MFVLLACVGGCSTSGDITINITYDVCARLGVTAASATEPQLASISDALVMWRDRGVAELHYAAATEAIEIRFEPAFAAAFGYYDDEAGVVYINSGLNDPKSMSIVIAHELGHAFGLEHVTDRPSLMNPGNRTTGPTAEDQAALEALWGACTPTAP